MVRGDGGTLAWGHQVPHRPMDSKSNQDFFPGCFRKLFKGIWCFWNIQWENNPAWYKLLSTIKLSYYIKHKICSAYFVVAGGCNRYGGGCAGCAGCVLCHYPPPIAPPGQTLHIHMNKHTLTHTHTHTHTHTQTYPQPPNPAPLWLPCT